MPDIQVLGGEEGQSGSEDEGDKCSEPSFLQELRRTQLMFSFLSTMIQDLLNGRIFLGNAKEVKR